MIDSVSIPISTCAARAPFLRGCLQSLYMNSERRHEVVLCSEDPPEKVQAVVDEWETLLPSWPARLAWKGKLEVRIAHVQPWQLSTRELFSPAAYQALSVERGYQGAERAYAAGYNPLYQMLQAGALLSSRPFLCTPAGDDSYFAPGWEAILDAVDPSLSRQRVWVPRYVYVEPRTRTDFLGDPDCIFPLEGQEDIAESWLLSEIAVRRGAPGTIEEPAGVRNLVKWPNGVLSRELFALAGGYQALPPYPHAQDLALHQRLAGLGVVSVGVHSSVVVNSKVPVRLGA